MNPIFNQFQPLSAIAVTQNIARQIQPLCTNIKIKLWLPESIKIKGCFNYSRPLQEHLSKIWGENHILIFTLALGAVVRLIGPLLEHKTTDPGIIVIDFEGKNVISLCGNHQKNADLLTQLLAHQLDFTPIITGGSHSLKLPGIDIIGNPYGWVKGEGNWTEVSASIAREEKIQVIQDCGSILWQNSLPSSHSFYFNNEEGVSRKDAKTQRDFDGVKGIVWISAKKPNLSDFNVPIVQWHPRVLWVGIGCERGTSKNLIESAIKQVFTKYNLSEKAIAAIATIDIKEDEQGILELCKQWNLPLKTFTATELSQVEVPNPSDIVKQEVGSPSVAEAAAIKAATLLNSSPTPLNPPLVSRVERVLIPKQIIKQEGEKGAVTIAVAQSEWEYTGREGKIYLVGTGPGSIEHITPEAKTAITQADAVIGYSLYLELISSLFRPGQIIEPFPITQEIQRAKRAISLAQWGLTVAVVSSGDCGIYAMGGLVLEELVNQGWDGKTPSIQVFAGITAMQAAASKLGAPLMHDFCAISLSDLLTPWDVIQKRIIAAASADFVTAIYNPKSKTRTQQIITTQEIFLQYRSANTPVAICHSVTRDDEQITLTTLDQMLDYDIDMLTVIIIGNSSTRQYFNWMITPRGYQFSFQ
jgi:cobalt-precorrin 5A hydrolase/precorrin-3B C17-methyltransferase